MFTTATRPAAAAALTGLALLATAGLTGCSGQAQQAAAAGTTSATAGQVQVTSAAAGQGSAAQAAAISANLVNPEDAAPTVRVGQVTKQVQPVVTKAVAKAPTGGEVKEEPLYKRDPLRVRVLSVAPGQLSYDAYILCLKARPARDNDPACGSSAGRGTQWIIDRNHTVVNLEVAPSALYAWFDASNMPHTPAPWGESFLDGTLKEGSVTNFRAALALDARGRVAEVDRYAPGSMG